MLDKAIFALLAYAVSASTAFAGGPGPTDRSPQIELYHILVATEAEAKKLREEHARKGGDLDAFAALARRHSKDVATRPLGGGLGWVGEKSGLDPRFLQAAFTLDPGGVSKPVRTPYGWHLIFARWTRNGFEAVRKKYEGKRGQVAAEPPPEGNLKRRASDPKAAKVVERYLDALGGRATLTAIQDRTLKFQNVKKQETGDTVVEIALYMKKLRGDAPAVREEWDVKGFQVEGKSLAFTQIYNGALHEGWVVMMGTVSMLSGKILQVFVWDKHIDDLFVSWKESGYTLEHEGTGTVGAESVDLVKVADFSGRQSTVYAFSRKTGLLLRKAWTQPRENGEAGEVTKEHLYQDYTKVEFSDGSTHAVYFPRKLTVQVDGQLDTVRTYTHIRYNSGLDDALFAKPEGKAFGGE